jgi:hypothetical protein
MNMALKDAAIINPPISKENKPPTAIARDRRQPASAIGSPGDPKFNKLRTLPVQNGHSVGHNMKTKSAKPK